MDIYPNENDVLLSEIQTTTESVELITSAVIEAEEPINTTPGYVYRLVCKPTGQFYYGYRMDNMKYGRMPIDDFWVEYFTSSDPVKKLIAEYGYDSFEHEIIFESTDTDAVYWYEQQVIKEHIRDDLSLNLQYVKDGKPKFVATSAGGKKAAATRKRNGTDKIAVQKGLATKAANGTAKIGGQKSLATKLKKGITKAIGAKSLATRRANGSMASSLKAASASLMKTWEVTSPTGEVQVIVNLEEFCRERGLSATQLGDVNKGKSNNHRGWTCKCLSTPPDEWQAEYDKNVALRTSSGNCGQRGNLSNVGMWEITKPDGEIIMVENLRQFCRDNGLNNSCMLDVSKGRHVTHKGWLCKNIPIEKPIDYWEITNPQGETVITTELKQFCIDNDLNMRTMKKLANGYTINHHGGWLCKKVVN
jgi:hypothetical protein